MFTSNPRNGRRPRAWIYDSILTARFRTFLALGLSALIFLAPLSATAFARSADSKRAGSKLAANANFEVVHDNEGSQEANLKPQTNNVDGFIIEMVNGVATCREATIAELPEVVAPPDAPTIPAKDLVNPVGKSGSSNITTTNAGALTIDFNVMSQLAADPDRDTIIAAFQRAAAVWTDRIKSPVTISINIDYGVNLPGGTQPFGPNTLGSTGSQSISIDYPGLRNNLILSASSAGESTIYNALPSSSVPTDIGSGSFISINSSNAKALGISTPTGAIATMGFNKNFAFDFNPDDGIDPSKTDFVAVATHEIGHALGFTSNAGAGSNPTPKVWDIFRFRTGTTFGNFATAPRILSVGGPDGNTEQYYFTGQSFTVTTVGTNTPSSVGELQLSTGGPNGVSTSNGDGRQSSHWKADEKSGKYIGIMDPTIASGVHQVATENDFAVLETIGWNLVSTVAIPPPPPPPPAPANDNFASAQVIAGCSGSVVGTNASATKETGEPNHSPDNGGGTHSVWYQWQAPSSTSVTITTSGSSYDTVMGVYTGSSVDALTVVGKSDDVGGGDTTSSVTFTAQAGTVYRIAVDGYNNGGSGGDIGSIKLNWDQTNCTSSCSYSISPTNNSFSSTAGTGSVNVTSTSGCTWTAQSNASWITISSGASGSGNGTVNYSVTANTGPQRTGTLTVAGQTFTVTQGSGCTYSINPSAQDFGASGSTGIVNVTSTGGCTWTATSNANWVTITSGASGSGNGTVGFSVAANPDSSQRTGTITIAGQTFTVTQGPSCSYSISPTIQNFGAGAGTNSINVTAAGGCTWTAQSNASWITISSGASGSGNGTVNYSVTANTGPQRTGTLTVAGQTFTVTQGSGCTYSISLSAQSFGASGSAGIVNVTSTGGCTWTAQSNDAWISITSGASGTGNGTVGFSVAANPNPSQRTGTLTVAGQTFNISQDGVSCSYSISPTNNSFSSTAGTGSVNVTSTSGCTWTAQSNASWITISSGASGTGNGIVSYSVTANTTTSLRTGALSIAGQTFTISQGGLAQPILTVGLSSVTYSVNEADPIGVVIITVNRTGDISSAASVDYATSDTSALIPCQTNGNGIASDRCDYATAVGTLRFAAGEGEKFVAIPIINDGYVEPNETFSITLRNPQGLSLGTNNSAAVIIVDDDAQMATTNPIDGQAFFIKEQYIDFLGRVAEPAGFAFWMNRMSNCPAGDICDRTDTSKRFYESDEFKERGFYVYRLYDALLGRLPKYAEFVPDVARLNGPQTVQEQRLGKDAYLLDFMDKAQFRNLYDQYLTADHLHAKDSASATGFVNALCATSGITPASKQTLITNLQNGIRDPAHTLEDFILTPEMSNVGTLFYDRGIITMQYFGYLRRDPDTGGFTFWQNQLIGPNAPHKQDYRFMVGGFLQSDEYRFRFALISAP